jgi:NAD(P)-dependent dehydrogenase (short-subunit alcohol dehydrogenase family)
MGFPFSDGVAVITGAGKGIGAALAHGLAARRCYLALIDNDAEALARVVTSTRQTGVTVSSHQLDIANAEAVAALPQEVLAHHRASTFSSIMPAWLSWEALPSSPLKIWSGYSPSISGARCECAMPSWAPCGVNP